MRIETATDNRGARGLLAYIRANFPSIPHFCQEKGLDRLRVQKAIRGQTKRIDVDFAVAVEAATGAEVPASWWAETAADEPPATGTEGGG